MLAARKCGASQIGHDLAPIGSNLIQLPAARGNQLFNGV
jgi:hypothetical protein